MRGHIIISCILIIGCLTVGSVLWSLKTQESLLIPANLLAAINADELSLARARAELNQTKQANALVKEKENARPLSWREKIALKVAAPESQALIASQLEPSARVYRSIYDLIGQGGPLSSAEFQAIFLATASGNTAVKGETNTFHDLLRENLTHCGIPESEAVAVSLCGEYQLRLLAQGAALSSDQLRGFAVLLKNNGAAMLYPEAGQPAIVGPFQPKDLLAAQKLLSPDQFRELADFDRELSTR